MPAPGNLLNTVRVVKGQTKVLELEVKTKEGRVASLSGAEIYFTVREEASGAALISLTTANGIQITDAANGLATITISSTDSDIAKGCFYYDVWVEFSAPSPPERHPVVKRSEFIVEDTFTTFP